MGLDLWFREDVARLLAGLGQAATRYDGEFQEGYAAALRDVALSFGLVTPRSDVDQVVEVQKDRSRRWG